MKKIVLSSLLILFGLNSFAQKKAWFESEHRNTKWPSSIYYKEYATGGNKSEALELAKINLSKSIITEVSSRNTFKSVTQNSVYSDIFKESATTESSVSLTALEERVSYTKKKKICHVLIFIKKEDLKSHTKTKYNDLINSIIGEINSCQRMYNDNSIKEAKVKGDAIDLEKKKLKRLKNLLSVFEISYDPKRFNNVIEAFEPLYARIKQHISDEEDYKKNKDQGDLKSMSIHDYELEEALQFYIKAQKINPELALEDEIPTSIKEINNTLFKKYCQKGQNFELEKNYDKAVYFYKKARNIFPQKYTHGEKHTTTEKIIECQNLEINLKISEGNEELKDNPKIALVKFKAAKLMANNMGRTERIRPLNKLIRKAKRAIRKIEIGIQRGKSSHRLLISLGGGFQTGYSAYRTIYSDPINFNVKNWNLRSTLGYRMNLPDIKRVTKSGREISKGNVLALFLKKGNTNIDSVNTVNFTEFEFGYIFKEWLRLSAGIGNREIPNDYDPSSFLSSYYTTTGGLTFHFGRLSTDLTVTYLFNNDFEPMDAKLSANVGLRFYLYKKIYKTTKEGIE